MVIFGDVSIEGSDKIFNPKHNRYYLKNRDDLTSYKGKLLLNLGFQKTYFSRLDRGGFPYFCPGGWMRLSLNVVEN